MSEVPAVGKVSLVDLPGIDADILEETVRRVLPDQPTVPAAAFNSAI